MKYILLLITCFFSLSNLKAQSATETLEWLNAKKVDIQFPRSNVGYVDKVEITDTYFKVYKFQNSSNSASVNWSKIKEVRKGDNEFTITIICDWTHEGQTGYISMFIGNKELVVKYIKALKHMATLKGAKMINSDLF